MTAPSHWTTQMVGIYVRALKVASDQLHSEAAAVASKDAPRAAALRVVADEIWKLAEAAR